MALDSYTAGAAVGTFLEGPLRTAAQQPSLRFDPRGAADVHFFDTIEQRMASTGADEAAAT